MRKINFYIYYDKNGEFLGALKKAGKPSNPNCIKVTEEEFNRVVALHGLPIETTPETSTEAVEEVTEEITEPADTNSTEEGEE